MQEYDEVLLKDGRRGHLIEILEQGVAYLFEWKTPHGESKYDNEVIMEDDIEKVLKRMQ